MTRSPLGSHEAPGPRPWSRASLASSPRPQRFALHTRHDAARLDATMDTRDYRSPAATIVAIVQARRALQAAFNATSAMLGLTEHDTIKPGKPASTAAALASAQRDAALASDLLASLGTVHAVASIDPIKPSGASHSHVRVAMIGWYGDPIDGRPMLEVWQCDGEARWCAWLRDKPRENDGSPEIGSGPTMRAAIVDLARQIVKRR